MNTTYIEQGEETANIVIRILGRFAGDVDATFANLAANDIVFGKIAPAPVCEEPHVVDQVPVDQVEEPKEWVEHQEQERRAWAVNSAIEVLKYADSWNQDTILELADKMVVFVKGSNPDLNDVEATDSFYLIMGERIMAEGEITEENLEEFLIGCLDEMAKNGVRLKDGKKLEVVV